MRVLLRMDTRGRRFTVTLNKKEKEKFIALASDLGISESELLSQAFLLSLKELDKRRDSLNSLKAERR